MAEIGDETGDRVENVGSLLIDDSTEQEVESLWRQLMVYKSFSGSELAEAKAKRVVAQATRQQAEIDAVRSTRDATDRMRHRAEEQLTESNDLKEQAARDRAQAEAELSRSVASRAQAETEARSAVEEAETRAGLILTEAGKQAEAQLSDAQTQGRTIVAQAEEDARQVVDAARAKAHQETTELKRQALQEIKSVMTHIQEMSAAASEELETQRILTNIAQIRASTKRVLEEATDHTADVWAASPESESDADDLSMPAGGAELSEDIAETDEAAQGQEQSEAVQPLKSASRRAKKHASADA